MSLTISWITGFHGRHSKVERVIRCFLEQDYHGQQYLLLYNNSKVSQTLDFIDTPYNKQIILVNNYKDLQTKEEYTNTGNVFRDSLTFLPDDTEVVTFADSDDLFLPDHTSKGAEGIEKAYLEGKLAYKPYYSWFLFGDSIKEAHNNLEPSIFVDLNYIKAEGFNQTSYTYHQRWLDKLTVFGKIHVINSKSTLLYNWEKDHNTYKISGAGDDTEVNFRNHRKYETDNGDLVLTPSPVKDVRRYYKLTDVQ